MLRVPGADASSPDAHDAVQSVFVRVLETDRLTLAEVQNVQAWLTASVRRIVLNTLRSGGRRQALHLRLVRDGVEPHMSAMPVAQSDLLRALDRLPDDARELLLLKHVARLTLEQIALSLDENRNTIASRVQAAMERLREAMTVHQGEQPRVAARTVSPSGTGPVRP